MIARILFARHGNTFGPDDKVVWVGRGSDLPLVDKGRVQAHDAATVLKAQGLIPSAVLAAGLKRTGEFANIVCKDLGIAAPVTESRLDEIHYGRWEGATTEEMTADPVCAAALTGWQQSDIWPDALGWHTTQQDVINALSAVLNQILAGAFGSSPLVVSSNGILRFAPRILGISAAHSFQLKTGALGCLEHDGGAWSVRFWGKTG